MRKFTGTVNLDHFGQFYSLVVKYDGIWLDSPETVQTGIVRFGLEVQDEDGAAFHDELCRLLPCVELDKEPSLFQRIKNFLTKKGDSCDQCC